MIGPGLPACLPSDRLLRVREHCKDLLACAGLPAAPAAAAIQTPPPPPLSFPCINISFLVFVCMCPLLLSDCKTWCAAAAVGAVGATGGEHTYAGAAAAAQRLQSQSQS